MMNLPACGRRTAAMIEMMMTELAAASTRSECGHSTDGAIEEMLMGAKCSADPLCLLSLM